MSFFDILVLLFGGIGATLIGIYVTKRIEDKRLSRTSISGIYPPITFTTNKWSDPKITEPPIWLKDLIHTQPSTSNTVLPYFEQKNWVSPGILPNNLGSNSDDVNQWPPGGTWPPISGTQSLSTWLKQPDSNIDNYLSKSGFDPALTKLVNFNDGSASMVTNDKFLYVDKNDGVMLASQHDPEKWEEVEFRKTSDELVYRLRKKK